jgi:3'(2'), 5'-bisphosphate nucleotidase
MDIKLFVDIAEQAGQRTLKYFGQNPEVYTKSDQSPLTQADLEADAYIVEHLKVLWGHIPIVSEEAADHDALQSQLQGKATYFLVDPLDGTKEFVNNRPGFTVNIALIKAGIPVMGVVHAPVLETTYYAERGHGAWKKTSQGLEQIFCSSHDGERALHVIASRSHRDEKTEQFLNQIDLKEPVAIGSSLKFCLLAEGKADVYPRFGPTMEWDVAAGDCVYRNAGHEEQNPSPFVYNKAGFRNGPFIIGSISPPIKVLFDTLVDG